MGILEAILPQMGLKMGMPPSQCGIHFRLQPKPSSNLLLKIVIYIPPNKMAGFLQNFGETFVPISRQTIDAGALALTASPGLRPPPPLSSPVAWSTATPSVETGQPQQRVMLNGHSALMSFGVWNISRTKWSFWKKHRTILIMGWILQHEGWRTNWVCPLSRHYDAC